MTTILPRDELVKRAIRWISDERVAHPEQSLAKIVDHASLRFDLSPTEQEWLQRTFGS